MTIAAIADDFTGATDVAVAFRRAGLGVGIVFGVPDDSTPAGGYDAIVIALKSRTIPAADAVGQSLGSLAWAQRRGYERCYFKYCSTFDSSPRGNIGPVSDALADRLGAALTIVTPASPVHGRTVYRGHLFVGDQLLSESPMRHHPLTPMTDSNLVTVLGTQTERPIGLLRHETVRQGSEAIARELAALRDAGIRYAVADALSDDELAAIGRAAAGDALVTGAAGLAGGLAAALAAGSARGDALRETDLGPYDRPAVIAGSCSARTLEQVARMARSRPSHRLDVLHDPRPERLCERALAWYDGLDPASGAPIIHSSLPPEELRAVQDALGVEAAAQIVESALGSIASGLVARGVDRLVVAGGETSGSVTSALGIRTGAIGSEAAPGVPWILVEAPHRLALLLKSGNFGTEELLAAASARAGEERDG